MPFRAAQSALSLPRASRIRCGRGWAPALLALTVLLTLAPLHGSLHHPHSRGATAGASLVPECPVCVAGVQGATPLGCSQCAIEEVDLAFTGIRVAAPAPPSYAAPDLSSASPRSPPAR